MMSYGRNWMEVKKLIERKKKEAEEEIRRIHKKQWDAAPRDSLYYPILSEWIDNVVVRHKGDLEQIVKTTRVLRDIPSHLDYSIMVTDVRLVSTFVQQVKHTNQLHFHSDVIHDLNYITVLLNDIVYTFMKKMGIESAGYEEVNVRCLAECRPNYLLWNLLGYLYQPVMYFILRVEIDSR